MTAAATAIPVVSAAHATPTVPGLSVSDVDVWEGDSGSLAVAVSVDLSQAAATKVKVHYTVATDSATPDDFGMRSGNLTFSIGATSKKVVVNVYGDSGQESDEHILVRLSAPVGADLLKPDGGITIHDDDADGVSPTPEVTVGDVTIVEGNNGSRTAYLPVTLSSPAADKTKVAYNTQCGTTAEQSDDFSGKPSGTVTFQRGQRSKVIAFKVTADFTPENATERILEKIRVSLGPAVIRTDAVNGKVTILDDDGQAPIPPPPAFEISRVSVASDGSEASPAPQAFCSAQLTVPARGSYREALSADGRFVAFQSDSPDLVDDDTNQIMDAFVHDNVTGVTERVSIAPDGSQFFDTNAWAGGADMPAISADGRYVTYNVSQRLYVRDRVAATTTLLHLAVDGSSGAVSSSDPAPISADGRYVVFKSSASNLVAPTPTPQGDWVYVHDTSLGTTQLIGPSIPAVLDYPVISADGRYVAFDSDATNLVAGDTNGCTDTFVRDLVTGTTERVSVTSSGAEQADNSPYSVCSYGNMKISGDGRFVAFTSHAWNLYPGATTATDLGSGAPERHAYVRDRLLGTTDMIDSLNLPTKQGIATGISDDGRYATYICFCGDPVPMFGGVNYPDQVSVWTDRLTGVSRIVGEQADGTPPLDEDTGYITFTFTWGGMSADGSTVAFDSYATNLVGDDTNGVPDVFIEVFH